MNLWDCIKRFGFISGLYTYYYDGFYIMIEGKTIRSVIISVLFTITCLSIGFILGKLLSNI